METQLYLIALKERLLTQTIITKNGCWHCTAGGENTRYGSIWFINRNIGNHQASWLVHKGAIPSGMLVCHTCDYPRCINPEHLFLGTYKDNNSDRKLKGNNSNRVGANNHMAFLTEDNVREIKHRLEHGGSTQREIAESFRVSQSIISDIKRGKKWVHVR